MVDVGKECGDAVVDGVFFVDIECLAVESTRLVVEHRLADKPNVFRGSAVDLGLAAEVDFSVDNLNLEYRLVGVGVHCPLAAGQGEGREVEAVVVESEHAQLFEAVEVDFRQEVAVEVEGVDVGNICGIEFGNFVTAEIELVKNRVWREFHRLNLVVGERRAFDGRGSGKVEFGKFISGE